MLLDWNRVLAAPPPVGRQLTQPSATNTARALAGRLLAHLDWLLAHPDHADQVVHDLTAVVRDARSTVSPGAPMGVTLGACPEPTVRHDEDGNLVKATCDAPVRAFRGRPLISCPQCGVTADAWTWRDRIAGTLDPSEAPVADAYALAPWLSAAWRRPITVEVIRQFASRGTKRAGRLARAVYVTPALTPDGDPAVIVRRNTKGRTLYEIATVTTYITAVYGKAPEEYP